MKTKRVSLVIGMVVILLASLAWMISDSEIIHGADTDPPVSTRIAVSGMDAGSASILDESGNPVKPDDPFYLWNNYTINYQWSIDDGAPIVAGDTTSFEIPSSVRVNADINDLPIYNELGVQIGSFSIKAGDKVGTITFNDAFASTSVDRKGTLTLHVRGTNSSPENPNLPTWNINKVGWLSEYTESNLPKYVVWNVAFNPRSESLTNAVVTDVLSSNQTYVEGSVYAPTGSYNATGSFVSDGGVAQPEVTVNGKTVQFNFGSINKAVDMTFKVLIDVNASAQNTWTDDATLTSDQITGNVGANVNWGGSGSGSGGTLGMVILQKTDKQSQSLTGAAYELKTSKGQVLASEAPVDENGQLIIHDLPQGTYTLTEVKAPNGYAINKEPITFTVSADATGQVPTIDLTQKDIPLGNIYLHKTSATTGVPLKGAVYDLLDEHENVLQTGLTTDENGDIQINGLDPGSYFLKEVSAPEGYQTSTILIPVTVNPGETTQAPQQDQPDESDENDNSIVLTKIDKETKVPLPGATYQLTDSLGEVILANLVTDVSGKIQLNNLAAGTYALTEIKAPEGYDLNQDPLEFTINSGTLEVTLTGEDYKTGGNPGEPGNPENPVPDKEGGLTLRKVDQATNRPLAGAVYQLADSEGKVLHDNLVTDSEGQIALTNLPFGTYYLTEVKAPAGYQINKTPISVTIEKNESYELIAKDQKVPTEPEKPVIPGEPGNPTEPEKPVIPGEPGNPTEPEKPVIPGEPGNPTEPEKPIIPGEPGNPTEPEKPVIPGEPENPSEPEKPTTPDEPENPLVPEVPGTENDQGASSEETGSTPTNPIKPGVTLPGGNGSPAQTGTAQSTGTGSAKGTKRFPQTGEKAEPMVTILGIVLILGLVGFELKRKHA